MKNIHTIFTPEKAEEIAAELNEDKEGDGWAYIVEVNPNPDGPKTAIIRILDENLEFVGLL